MTNTIQSLKMVARSTDLLKFQVKSLLIGPEKKVISEKSMAVLLDYPYDLPEATDSADVEPLCEVGYETKEEQVLTTYAIPKSKLSLAKEHFLKYYKACKGELELFLSYIEL
jgi:hypothetical protein